MFVCFLPVNCWCSSLQVTPCAAGQRFHTPKIIEKCIELGKQKLDFDENLNHIFNKLNTNALSDTQSEKRETLVYQSCCWYSE